MSASPSQAAINHVVREHYGRILSGLIGKIGHFHLAEDCLQDAIQSALTSWPVSGIPPNPVAWLLTAAKNKAIDQFRREHRFNVKQHLLIEDGVSSESNAEEISDERLRLIFTCCHPALNQNAQIALTLKTLCGLSTAQLSQAFLCKEEAIAQRIVRAKNKIAKTAISYEVPPESQWAERLASVLEVIYLIFNEGYRSNAQQQMIDVNLCEEALYLNKALVQLLPNDAEAIGLLSLMNFHYSRFNARLTNNGTSISLRDQNRSKWNHSCIVLADKLLKNAALKAQVGPYQIQAAISGVHAHSSSHQATDWNQIYLLYQKLQEYDASAVIGLNAAVALSFAKTPQDGLDAMLILPNQGKFQDYQPWHAAKADMLARAGDKIAAKQAYQTAIKLTHNKADRAYLNKQLSLLH